MTNTDSQGHQILTLAKLPALHAAVMKACADADGVIQDPRNCTFNPASIMCPSGTDKPTCLTPAQVTAVREEYRGPTDPAGRNLYDGGEPYGSELAWNWFINPDTDNNPADTVAGQFGLNYLKYMASVPNPPASFTLSDLKFTDAEYSELEQFGGVYNATDPDLSAFRAHGGKLIIYHGWADQAIPPFSTIDYYAAVEKAMGGFASSAELLAAVHGSRRVPLPGRRRPGGNRKLPHPADQLGGEGTGAGRADLPSHRADNRVHDHVPHRVATQRRHAGAAQQRAEQQLPLHRDQQRVQSGADLVHATRFHHRLPDPALATGRAGG